MCETRERAYFKLESEELLDLNDFTAVAFKITHLMCFAMDDVVAMKNVSATSCEIPRDLGDGKQDSVPIKIYYQSIPYSEKVPKRDSHDMLFNYGAIKDKAHQVFNNWINAYEYLSPAFGLYFSTKMGARKYLDGKFLAFAQGLEIFHRRTSDEKLMEPEVFESLAVCPDDHIDWLKGRLMQGNEINLRKRLKRLIEPFKEHLGTSEERNKFIRKIVDMRNYLTHYNENLEGEFVKERNLYILCLKMEFILNLHFLNVIGFTVDEVKKIVKNCEPLKRKLQKN
ncbi:HEPN domain-containing protein [Arsenophonus sp. PmNCSU2021_1]|uniref:HEPN domain-containing protein n=1 Tax=Arsenophonus sp. PmNCSU2021_1 TaxID=3118989 RepID=UPI002FF02BD4